MDKFQCFQARQRSADLRCLERSWQGAGLEICRASMPCSCLGSPGGQIVRACKPVSNAIWQQEGPLQGGWSDKRSWVLRPGQLYGAAIWKARYPRALSRNRCPRHLQQDRWYGYSAQSDGSQFHGIRLDDQARSSSTQAVKRTNCRHWITLWWSINWLAGRLLCLKGCRSLVFPHFGGRRRKYQSLVNDPRFLHGIKFSRKFTH